MARKGPKKPSKELRDGLSSLEGAQAITESPHNPVPWGCGGNADKASARQEAGGAEAVKMCTNSSKASKFNTSSCYDAMI